MIRVNLQKIIGNTINLAICKTQFGTNVLGSSRAWCVFIVRPGFRNLRGAPRRAIWDVKMQQKDSKRNHE